MKTAVGYMILTEGAKVPSYSSTNAAGADVFSIENVVITAGEWKLIKTGIALEIPVGYEVQCRSRSGMAAKYGISVLNSPGTIDSDYRGEIMVILMNNSVWPYTVNIGDRIAQLVLAKHETAYFCDEKELTPTDRGEAGFGSTGV